MVGRMIYIHMTDKCIYKIRNVRTNDEYVGSTSTGFVWRKRKHLRELKAGNHHNRHLQNAYNLYGVETFSFEILESVNDITKLIEREQYWITKVNPIYNVMRDIKSHIGVKRSEETRAKISDSLKGRKLSDEHKKSITKTLTGKKHSEETIQKRAAAAFNPILQYNKAGKLIKEWTSATEASRLLKISRNSIYRCISGIRPTYKTFIWKKK